MMVFNLSSRKKKNTKLPTRINSKVHMRSKGQRNVTVVDNVTAMSPDRSRYFPESSIYRKLSSSRAIFESNKLESACSFLKFLKEKLEKDVDTKREDASLYRPPTSENLPDILDTLIDVSDNISPIVSDVSSSMKSLYRRRISESSSVSEKHFNKTMIATNKLLELTKKNRRTAPDNAYYYAHKIIANNFEELSSFKDNLKTSGEKIYVDKKLLDQLIELHTLLKDTINKLKMQEDKYLANPRLPPEVTPRPASVTAVDPQESQTSDQPVTSTPKNQSLSKFPGDVSSITNDTTNANDTDASYYLTAPPGPPPGSPTSINKTPTKKTPKAGCLHPHTSSAYDTPQKARRNSSTLKASKMKKKELRASKTDIDSAELLSVEKLPYTGLTDPSVQVKEEEISMEDLISPAPSRGTKDPGPQIKSEPSPPPSPVPMIKKEEPRSPDNASLKSEEGPDKTFMDKSTTYSTPAIPIPKPQKKQATTDASCCGAKQPTDNQGTMTQGSQFADTHGTSTFDERKSKIVGTSSILKQKNPDASRNDISWMKNNRTQTTNVSGDAEDPFATPVSSKRTTANYSAQKEEVSKSITYESSMFDRLPTDQHPADYYDGLQKCIAELDCMSNCLRDAATSKQTVHECIAIFPENQQDLANTGLPHFHTVIEGIPVVIQFTKEAVPINNDLRDGKIKCCRKSCGVSTVADASTCCKEEKPETKSHHPCKIWGSLSKSGQERCPKYFGGCTKWRKTVPKPAKKAEKGDQSKYKQRTSLKGKLPFHLTNTQRERSVPPLDMSTMNTNVVADVVESSAGLPYVAAKSSLPKLDDPDKICSSLQFDVLSIPVTFPDSIPYHPDGNVNRALKNVTVEQLLDSFRPAKCCRKAVLNEKSRGTRPYAASLQSLPLQDGDLRTINAIMQSNYVRAYIKQQTLFDYYINFQKNTINGNYNKDKLVAMMTTTAACYRQPPTLAYFFELFKKDDDDAQRSASTSRAAHDMRILDFIKKIYTSEPLYENVSKRYHSNCRARHDAANEKPNPQSKEKSERSNSDKRKHSSSEKKQHHHRHHHHHHHQQQQQQQQQQQNKYKKTETKSYYTSVELMSTSKTDCYPNTSTSSVVSSKYARSRNSSNSTMYSFLLIPKSELNGCLSNNDLSTSYSPSVNSLPRDDDIENASTSCSDYKSNNTRGCSGTSLEDYDEDFLSPKNYAETLDGIYELDENGSIRAKGRLFEPDKKVETIIEDFLLSSESNLDDVPSNAHNLSTIYETDEKSVSRDSEPNFSRKSKSCKIRSKSLSPKSSVTIHITTNDRSRIPVRNHSHSTGTICKDKVNNTNRLSKVTSRCSDISTSTRRSSMITNSPTSSKIDLQPKPSYTSSRKLNQSSSSNVSQCKWPEKTYQSSFCSVQTSTSIKDFLPKIQPRVSVRPSNLRTSLKPLELDSSDTLQLPITFDIVRPRRNTRGGNIRIDNNVVSLNIDNPGSSNSIQDRGKELKCYRSEKLSVWPQLQKMSEASNNNIYVSVHSYGQDMLVKNKSRDLPRRQDASSTTHHQETEKPKRLTFENFAIGSVGSDCENKSILKKTSSSDKKNKRKVRHIRPEVIDIKVPKDIKCTRLKHRFFQDGDRPGYVTVLSTPCNCPDITIFLPCCCGQSESSVFRNGLVREAQQYTMVPISEKGSLK